MGRPIDHHGYARLLGACRLRAMSPPELADSGDFVWPSKSIGRAMRGLRTVGLVHIASYLIYERHCAPQPQYRMGPGEEPPPPATVRGRQSAHPATIPRTVRPTCSLAVLKAVIRAMEARPSSPLDVATSAGINIDTAYRLIETMRANRLCHLATWVRGKAGPAVPHYSFGAGADAQKPTPIRPAHYTRLARSTRAALLATQGAAA